MIMCGNVDIGEIDISQVKIPSIHLHVIGWEGNRVSSGGGEIEVISNCWLLENSVGAWLWEDGTPMLLESNPVRLMRVFKK